MQLISRIGLLLLMFLCSTVISASPTKKYSLSIHQVTYQNPITQQQLDTLIYYPTENSQGEQRYFSNSKAFQGIETTIDQPTAEGRFPLIIISHGSGGNNMNQAYLAKQLAEKGIIVAAANHPGNTTGDSDPKIGIQVWRQNEDISALLTAITTDPQWQQHIDYQQIGVLGHSKGGYSALATAGGRLDFDKTVAFCRQQQQHPLCLFLDPDGTQFAKQDRQKFTASYHDPRVKFVIALDPAFSAAAPYFTLFQLESLHAVSIPVLLLSADPYIDAFSLNADSLADELPLDYRTYTMIKKANHYSFLSVCTERGVAILTEEGEEFICQEHSSRSRGEIHQEITTHVEQFLQKIGVLK